jgi:hypothetical protein
MSTLTQEAATVSILATTEKLSTEKSDCGSATVSCHCKLLANSLTLQSSSTKEHSLECPSLERHQKGAETATGVPYD